MNLRYLTRCGILLAAWLMATAMGPCGFFKPTQPELPSAKPIPTDFSTPTATLATMALGMVDKSGIGQNVYLSGLADSVAGDGRDFHALFDPADLAQRPLIGDWTLQNEPQLLRKLYLDYPSPFEMTWEPYEPAGNETGTANDSLLHRKYTLVQVITTGNTVRRDVIAVGAADLYFVRSERTAANWLIAIWQDARTPDNDETKITLGRRRLQTQ